MKDLVTVVVPCFNVENYLVECVDSILYQTYQNLEIILVDDGSTDSTGVICDSYLYDNRVKVIHKQNGGLSSARNAGLDVAKGEWIYFCDGDDYISDDMIETNIVLANRGSVDVLFFDYYDVKEDGKNKEVQSRKREIKKCTWEDGCVTLIELMKKNQYEASVPLHIYRLKFLLDYKIRFYDGILHEDELFSFMVYSNASRVTFNQKEFYYRRIRDNSIMMSKVTYENYRGLKVACDEVAKIGAYKNKAYRCARLMYIARLFDLLFCKLVHLENRAVLFNEFLLFLKGFKKTERTFDVIRYTKWKLLIPKYKLLFWVERKKYENSLCDE